MRTCMRGSAVCFWFLCAVGAAGGAFVVEPAIITFDAAAGERIAWAEVKNVGDGPIAVELTVFERVLDLDGELDRKAQVPSLDFTVYPSEIIIQPGRKASVQFQYKRKERVTADKAYTLFSKEVLIPLDEDEKEGVNVAVPTVLSYYTVVAFETGKEGRLTFVSSRALKDGMAELIVENRSGGRVAARNLAIKTDSDVIKNFTGVKNSIMPGQKRRFTFKYLRPLTSKEVKFIYDASD